MPHIIHIIHPMLAVIVTGEILGVLERHPLSIFLPVGGMIGHFVEYSVGAHQFGNKLVISEAFYVERYPPYILPQGFNKSKWLTFHVTVNLCPGAPLRPIISLLDQ